MMPMTGILSFSTGDEVLVAVVRPPGDLAEVDARLGDGEPIDRLH